MYVLGIETSCDETSVAIVRNGREVLSNEVASSLKWHKQYGGVIPEIASRIQLEIITEVQEKALKSSGVGFKDLDLVSVTNKPGLPGSLLVGISFAKAVSFSLGLPLVGVNHIVSHIYANYLEHKHIELPFVALVVSGGHTSLYYVEDFDRIRLLGETSDDACGEAFDKVAKILGLGYPGGPLIEKLALKGDRKKIKFSCSNTKNPLGFSFSGIKTAVLYLVKSKRLTPDLKKDIAASFQEAVVDVLVKKSILACREKKVKRLVVGGGVALNNRLRLKLSQASSESGIKAYFPSSGYCMDNAAMVAGLGYQLFKKGISSDLNLTLEQR